MTTRDTTRDPAQGVSARGTRIGAGAGTAAAGRSGGKVDAAGKTHRKAPGVGTAALEERSQAEKLRTALPMSKTSRLRGRG